MSQKTKTVLEVQAARTRLPQYTVAEVCDMVGVAPRSYHRWRSEMEFQERKVEVHLWPGQEPLVIRDGVRSYGRESTLMAIRLMSEKLRELTARLEEDEE